MSSYLTRNLIKGAQSVCVLKPADPFAYSKASLALNSEILSRTWSPGATTEDKIKRIFRERLAGQLLFVSAMLSSIGAAFLLSSLDLDIASMFFAVMPLLLQVWVSTRQV